MAMDGAEFEAPAMEEPEFEERGRPRIQPGYRAVPAFAAVGAAVMAGLALLTGSVGVAAIALLIAVVAAATGLPVLRARTDTVVADGNLVRGVAPERLGDDPTTVPLDRITGTEVVERPRSHPPTGPEGDPLDGFGGPRRTGWPAGPATLPDRPGVLVELDDGPRPRFPAVLPGPGIAGPLTVGEGPPGFLPTDDPAGLVEAIEAGGGATDRQDPAESTAPAEPDAGDGETEAEDG
ncbi:hypothetical protein BRD00_01170 [Halobacteriales archaeon QS_8_69_26]|nr:MAG: hypothetical protein BRD00_01170 [Halobacteriales archaeon QS_8_69_26]